MQRFVKVVMGLFIIITLLNPFLNLFRNSNSFEVFAWQTPGSESEAFNAKENSRLPGVNKELFLQNYEKQLALQMEALVKLVGGVKSAQVKTTLQAGNKIGEIKELKEVRVSVNQDQNETITVKEQKRIEKEITDMLSRYFNVQPERIKVVWR